MNRKNDDNSNNYAKNSQGISKPNEQTSKMLEGFS